MQVFHYDTVKKGSQACGERGNVLRGWELFGNGEGTRWTEVGRFSRIIAMTNMLAAVCFGAGAIVFGRFFFLAPRLSSERIGAPPTKLQLWFPWLPGQFTPAGEKLYKQMNGLLLIGWVLLMAGIVLSR